MAFIRRCIAPVSRQGHERTSPNGDVGALYGVSRTMGRAARLVSPRHHRWRRLLASLTLDPDDLARPVTPPSDHDFIICGPPRTGTSLVTAALFRPPRVVTVLEPWDGLRMAPAALFTSLREELESTGRLRRGRLDLAAVGQGAVRWTREGEPGPPVEVEPGYLLGVKWTAFWRYLDLLEETKFVVCLRHPVEVVRSFEQQGGRLAEGLDYDAAFNRKLNEDLAAATSDSAVRRVLLYDSVCSRLLPHLHRPNVFVVRYERWFTDADGLMAGLGKFLETDLGPCSVRLRRPESRVAADPETLDLVRRYCTTADALGYDLGA